MLPESPPGGSDAEPLTSLQVLPSVPSPQGTCHLDGYTVAGKM